MKNRILIADDEAALLKTMAFTLKRKGYETITFKDGYTAYKEIMEAFHNSNNYNLIITDIQMPELSGLELIKRVREAGVDTPILAITGYGNTDLIVDLMRAGCQDYLDKPFSINELINRISKLIKKGEVK